MSSCPRTRRPSQTLHQDHEAVWGERACLFILRREMGMLACAVGARARELVGDPAPLSPASSSSCNGLHLSAQVHNGATPPSQERRGPPPQPLVSVWLK